MKYKGSFINNCQYSDQYISELSIIKDFLMSLIFNEFYFSLIFDIRLCLLNLNNIHSQFFIHCNKWE